MVVIWLTGLSGSGKTTLAKELLNHIKAIHLDGDNVRKTINKDLNYSIEHRRENIRRIIEITKLLVNQGNNVIVSFISPIRNQREFAKKYIPNFLEVYLSTPLKVCMERDIKGLYKRLGNKMTGLGSPYEVPQNPDVNLDTSKLSVKECLTEIMKYFTWKKINHGGKPLNLTKNQYAIFIGRYQPFHIGHQNLIQQKLNEGENVLIMVRDIPNGEKNPYSTDDVVLMLEKLYKNKPVKVMKIPDISSVNYGRGVGYEINEWIPPEILSNISATDIRNNKKLELVPNEIRKFI